MCQVLREKTTNSSRYFELTNVGTLTMYRSGTVSRGNWKERDEQLCSATSGNQSNVMWHGIVSIIRANMCPGYIACWYEHTKRNLRHILLTGTSCSNLSSGYLASAATPSQFHLVFHFLSYCPDD
jgi:hypothetical protein